MRLAMRLPSKKGAAGDTPGTDPRDRESAQIIDLASRTAYPAVTQRKSSSDALGLAAGVAIVAVLGAVTMWSMNTARLEPQQPVTVAQPAPVPPTVPADALVQPLPGEVPVPADPATPPPPPQRIGPPAMYPPPHPQ